MVGRGSGGLESVRLYPNEIRLWIEVYNTMEIVEFANNTLPLAQVNIISYHSEPHTHSNIKEIKISADLREHQIDYILNSLDNLRILHADFKVNDNNLRLFSNKRLEELHLRLTDYLELKDFGFLSGLSNLKSVFLKGYVRERNTSDDPTALFIDSLKKLPLIQKIEINSRIPPKQQPNRDLTLDISQLEQFSSLKALSLIMVEVYERSGSNTSSVLSRLESVSLTNCYIRSDLLKMVEKMVSLKEFCYNSYEGSNSKAAEIIDRLPSLRKLAISQYLKKEGQDNVCEKAISRHSQLRDLKMFGYMGGGEDFRMMIANLSQLESISFARRVYMRVTRRCPAQHTSTISVEMIDAMSECLPNLSKLELNVATFEPKVLQAISIKLPKLQELEIISGETLKDADAIHIGKLKGLHTLVLGLGSFISSHIKLKIARNLRKYKIVDTPRSDFLGYCTQQSPMELRDRRNIRLIFSKYTQ